MTDRVEFEEGKVTLIQIDSLEEMTTMTLMMKMKTTRFLIQSKSIPKRTPNIKANRKSQLPSSSF